MGKRTHLVLIAALAPLVSCASAEFRPRAVGNLNASVLPTDELLAEGRMHFRSGNFALAAGSFRKAIRQSPERPDAYNGLAASYDRLGRFDLAERYYQEALAFAPADPKVRTNYAISLRMQGRMEEAALIEAETAALVAASDAAPAAAAPAPEAPAAYVEIILPPAEPVRPSRLQRMSAAEIALITSPDSELATALRGRRLAAAAETKLPIAKVRQTGREIEWRLDPAPAEAQARTASLRVLNAVGRRGQAARMQGHLRKIGWTRTSVGDASHARAESIVFCAPDQIDNARALARSLPFRAHISVAVRQPQPLTLVLGRNAVAFDDRLQGAART